MKYNALLALACLILVGTGCQSVRVRSHLTKAVGPLAGPSAAGIAELRQLPPVDVAKLASRNASKRNSPVQPVTYYQLQPVTHYQLPTGTIAEFDTPPTLWERTRADTFSLWEDVHDDRENFYTWKNAATSTGMFAIAAILAHSGTDQEFRDAWQEDVRSNSWDDFSSIAHELGEGKYVIAASCAATGVRYLMPYTPAGERVGEWGNRSARSLLVGFPSLLILQRVTGASRPLESSAGSDWVLFRDENGVSGHAFIGAVPFFCAANMAENRLVAASLYACATFSGISRINDDAHYLSQVMLGW